MAGKTESINFEATFKELEKVVEKLEGEVKLEKALELFEKGMKLSGDCEGFLKSAEKKVEILKKSAEGELNTEPFRAGDED